MRSKRKSPTANGAYKNKFPKGYNSKSFKEVNGLAISYLPTILGRWLPDGKIDGQEYTALNPKRADHKAGSFKVNINTGKWSDFATGDKGGDVISLAAYLFDLSQSEAKQHIENMLGVNHV